MDTLDKAKDKVQKICDALKKETLQPAKQEAKEIVENAHMQKEEIIEGARKDAEKIHIAEQEERENRKKSFEAALNLACRQALEGLKEQIEKKLFQENLQAVVNEESRKNDVIAKLINVVVQAIEEQGIDTELSAYIPTKISEKEINAHLLKKVIDKLKEKSVSLGDFYGGAKIEMKDEKITLDISDEAIRDLVANYIRRDFRDKLFAS